MEYSVKKLAEAYAHAISTTSKTIKREKKPKFNLDAYNDLEYLNLITSINLAFDNVDDFSLTEKFLKGE